MSSYGIASEITKIAIENKAIHLDNTRTDNQEEIEKANIFNAKQISDFYKTIYNAVSSAGE